MRHLNQNFPLTCVMHPWILLDLLAPLLRLRERPDLMDEKLCNIYVTIHTFILISLDRSDEKLFPAKNNSLPPWSVAHQDHFHFHRRFREGSLPTQRIMIEFATRAIVMIFLDLQMTLLKKSSKLFIATKHWIGTLPEKKKYLLKHVFQSFFF